jgi:hypothetical protein
MVERDLRAGFNDTRAPRASFENMDGATCKEPGRPRPDDHHRAKPADITPFPHPAKPPDKRI